MQKLKFTEYQILCKLVNPFIQVDFESLDNINWPRLWEIADQTHCLPELYQSIIRFDIRSKVPEDMFDALSEIHQGILLRCSLLREQIKEISSALNRSGISPIWLKGASLLIEENWEMNARLMNDLDFWIPDHSQQSIALNVLKEIGYITKNKSDDKYWSESHHFAPRMHPKRLATIEPHRHLVRRVFSELLPDDKTLSQVKWQKWQGYSVGVLNLEDKITHSLIQCSLMATPPLQSGFVRLMKVINLLRLLEKNGSKSFSENTVKRIKEGPFTGEISAFLTYLERDFEIPNPIAKNLWYCEKVDKNSYTYHGYTGWLIKKSFMPPISWKNFLRNPKLWPQKIYTRIQMLFGKRVI